MINPSDYEDLFEDVSLAESSLDISDEEYSDLVEIMNDPALFIEVVLKIQDKAGRLVPFVMNKPQKRLYDLYMKQKKEGKPVRLIILKARQMGFSTLVSALYYYEVVTARNIKSAVVAHKADASTNIFNKTRLYYDCSPDIFKPMKKASNAKELVFENPSTNNNIRRSNPGLRSSLKIETAVDKNVLRSDTVHFLHVSELAFWPYPEESMTSAMQAVPNQPNTAVIIESTANGIGGKFYDEWMRAERGESEFIPLFFPWYEMDEYRLPVPDDYVCTDEERELKDRFHLDDEQICWRRWCISANCGGDIDKFHQEYPATSHEAFLASGRPVFDPFSIEKRIEENPRPISMGRVVKDAGKIYYRTEHNGYLSVWKLPEEGKSYVIGIDTASGEKTGDYSVMSVFCHNDMEQVAEWHGHIPPDLLGEEANLLGRFYHMAWLIPEANNHGVSLIDALRRCHYPRVYKRRRTPDDKNDNAPSSRIGWWTSEQSKKHLIDTFGKFIRENVGKINSVGLLKECITYVYDDRGRANAQQGCHDDRVIAAALAVHGCRIRQPNANENINENNLITLYGVNSVTGY